MSVPEGEPKKDAPSTALARRTSAALSAELAARPFRLRKIYPLCGFGAGALLSIVLLFLINAFRIVNPALFGIIMIGAASMGWIGARPFARWRRPEQKLLHALHERYRERLLALEEVMSVTQLPEEEVVDKLLEAQQEYEIARKRVLEGKK